MKFSLDRCYISNNILNDVRNNLQMLFYNQLIINILYIMRSYTNMVI